MTNQIKLGPMDSAITTLLNSDKGKQKEQQSAAPSEQSHISIHLNTLVSLTIAENNASDDNARVIEMKNKIETNTYHVDTDALAKKLYHDVIAKTIG